MTKPALQSLSAALLEHPEDEEPFTSSHQCVGCGVWSPQGHGENTLISSAYGWRLARIPDGRGGHSYEWRCPPCWKRHKETGR
jgi:hypothetical protein